MYICSLVFFGKKVKKERVLPASLRDTAPALPQIFVDLLNGFGADNVFDGAGVFVRGRIRYTDDFGKKRLDNPVLTLEEMRGIPAVLREVDLLIFLVGDKA